MSTPSFAIEENFQTNIKKYYIEVYGCQMNVYDGSAISRILENLNFVQTKNVEDSDVVVLVTCHIREKAAEKIYSRLGVLRKLELRREKKILTVVVGCVAQAEGVEMTRRASNVDILLGPQNVHSLPELLVKNCKKIEHKINLKFEPEEKFDFLSGELKRKNSAFSEFLTIQEGCDKFCTFCVVPYTRGAEYSRPVMQIYNEALDIVNRGGKEIVLLGQNVNAYKGKYSNGKIFSLGNLIDFLSQLEKLVRIFYTTSHPIDVDETLFNVHKTQKKLIPFIHLPVQSGSNKILKRMNRKHSAEYYLSIIEKFRYYRPDIVFSSDFIVGFPGETDKDFEQTISLVKNVSYAQAFSFKYSPRVGTPGFDYKDQIDEKIKSERLAILQELLKQQQLQFNQSKVGKELTVLFDKKKNNKITGKTEYFQTVYSEDLDLYGKYCKFKIEDATQNTLKGRLIKLIN